MVIKVFLVDIQHVRFNQKYYTLQYARIYTCIHSITISRIVSPTIILQLYIHVVIGKPG